MITSPSFPSSGLKFQQNRLETIDYVEKNRPAAEALSKCVSENVEQQGLLRTFQSFLSSFGSNQQHKTQQSPLAGCVHLEPFKRKPMGVQDPMYSVPKR
jgi:hypothetical protein